MTCYNKKKVLLKIVRKEKLKLKVLSIRLYSRKNFNFILFLESIAKKKTEFLPSRIQEYLISLKREEFRQENQLQKEKQTVSFFFIYIYIFNFHFSFILTCVSVRLFT